jgi:oxygen-independent coproporphyrinogen-3 oxidase
VPDEDAVADFYVAACETLDSAGIAQYEISNFARTGFESCHNLKYWTRRPYLGFGVDAHSMLVSKVDAAASVRFSAADSLERYVAGSPLLKTAVPRSAALEEVFFLGLRLNRGVDLCKATAQLGAEQVEGTQYTVAELISEELLQRDGDLVRLTPRGRLLSNEVFERFISASDVPAKA